MNKHVFIFLLTLLTISAFGQRREQISNDEDDYLDEKFLGYGITTNTNSPLIGGFVVRSSTNVGKNKGRLVQRYIALELVNIKSLKEKAALPNFGNKFIYGKTNYLFSIRPEFGREWYLFNKGGEKSIGLSGILAAGPSIGIQKPYYIKYISSSENIETVVYNPSVHVDPTRFNGAAPFWHNLFTNVTVIPGAHVKAAVNFDMSTFGDNVSGIELGTTLEFFTKEPELIVPDFGSNPKAYLSAYLTLYFGSKK